MDSLKKTFTIILSFVYFFGTAQFSPNHSGQIVIGTVENFYSEILEEQREIWIHVPGDIDSTKRYPVIYLLDAAELFYGTTGMLKQLTQWQIPESIIVGITNTDRIRDFTPTNVPFSRNHNTETSGGADNFAKFLKNELQPFINRKFLTERNNTIVGHSTAGLFVIYSYLHHIDLFDNYLAIDPSLWWDNENLVTSSPAKIEMENHNEKMLYVAVANSLGDKMDTLKIRSDKSVSSEQIRANLNFYDWLKRNKNNLHFSWEYFETEDHGGVIIPAQYNGLRSLFSWFPFLEVWRFNTPKKYSIKELIEPYYTHYEKLSIHLKRKVKPKWQLVNDVGFFMLEGHNLPKKALAFLKMNADFYPNESKSFVALGNYYALQKDKKEAIKYYEKAIGMDGNEEAKKKLKEIANK